MSKAYPIAAGVAALTLACSALAQFGPPPPGSAQGTESGTYGSSIGSDVRGTGPMDRFGRPYDPMNPTDTGSKPVDPRDAREKRDGAENRGALRPGTPDASRATNAPGANMNPGLSAGSGPGGQPSMSPSMSPNMNPGLGAGSGPAPAGGNNAGARGGAGSR
jgi:hypothetical protein